MTGWIVNWSAVLGFGKVRGDDRIQRFAHRDDLLDVFALVRGQRVEFTPVDDAPRGPRAAAVRCRGPAVVAERR